MNTHWHIVMKVPSQSSGQFRSASRESKGTANGQCDPCRAWDEPDTINLNRELMAKMKERVDKPRDPILEEHAVEKWMGARKRNNHEGRVACV